MILSVRAGGIAAAVLGLAAVATCSTALQASDATPAIAAPAAPSTDDLRGRPLDELVHTLGRTATDDAQQDCLANAVYFEARGEPIEGQLAVAEVVLNRAASPRYRGTICDVVTQPAQFSFVRRGVIPPANRASLAWRKSVAIARIAQERLATRLSRNVLWYHADYVSPSWGRRLDRQTKIGLHIFYA